MPDAAVPSVIPRLSLLERFLRRILIGIYQLAGWNAEGRLPPDRKFVIMAANHTSNWDFLVFLGTIHALGRQVRFIGKHSLFKWPMGDFMRALGGVPVDRSAPQDLVSQIVAQFEANEDFALIVAPEGTRARTSDWKTGFYQIALRAGVPIVCAGPDYPTRRGVIGPVIRPSGSYAEDMKPAFAFFRTLTPKHPDRAAFPEGF
jgi:1-acyl-sn-glycerol-3-phosphate acyltransferase